MYDNSPKPWAYFIPGPTAGPGALARCQIPADRGEPGPSQGHCALVRHPGYGPLLDSAVIRFKPDIIYSYDLWLTICFG